MARKLLENGARLVEDARGRTPDMLVPIRRYHQALRMFREYNVPETSLKGLRTNRGLDELASAIKNCSLVTCRKISKNRDVSSSERLPCGCTPLVYALSRRQWDIVDLLLDFNAYTGGVACTQHRSGRSLNNHAIGMIISHPRFNQRLSQLLHKSLRKFQEHWIWCTVSPFHVASVANADAIDTLVTHIKDHRKVYG